MGYLEETLIFESSERKWYPNHGLIGINDNSQISFGYDQELFLDDEWGEKEFTQEEKIELVEFMINRWKKLLG